MEHHGTIKKLYDFQILKNNAGLDYQRVNGKYLHYCLGLWYHHAGRYGSILGAVWIGHFASTGQTGQVVCAMTMIQVLHVMMRI